MSNLGKFLEPLKDEDEKSIVFFRVKGEKDLIIPYSVGKAETPMGNVLVITFEKEEDFSGEILSSIFQAIMDG